MIKKDSELRDSKYGTYIESKVITDVVTNDRGQLEFQSVTESGRIIDYMKYESSLTLIK